jgi:hypothetical protein
MDLLDEIYMPKKNADEERYQNSIRRQQAGEQPSTNDVVQDMEQERMTWLESSHKKARIENTRTTTTNEEESLAPPISELCLLPSRRSFSETSDYEWSLALELPRPWSFPLQRVTCVDPVTN